MTGRARSSRGARSSCAARTLVGAFSVEQFRERGWVEELDVHASAHPWPALAMGRSRYSNYWPHGVSAAVHLGRVVEDLAQTQPDLMSLVHLIDGLDLYKH